MILKAAWHEIINSLRDKRSLFFALIYGPFILPMLVLGPIILMSGKRLNNIEAVKSVHVAGIEYAPYLMNFLHAKNFDIETAESNYQQRLLNQEYEVVLAIPADYRAALRQAKPATLTVYFANNRESSRDLNNQVRAALDEYGRQISGQRILARGIDPRLMLPMFVESEDLSEDEPFLRILAGMFLFVIILAAVIGPYSLAVDVIAGERERGSLEPLLSLPVPRYKLLLGKYLAVLSFCFGCSFVALTIAYLWLGFVPDVLMGSADRPTFVTWLSLLLFSLPLNLLFASSFLLVSIFSKTVKEAQAQISIIMFVVMAPFALVQFLDLDASSALSSLPVLGHYMNIQSILFDASQSVLSMVVLSLFTVFAAAGLFMESVRLFQRDQILS